MAATKLAVRRHPSGAASGVVFDYQPILEAQDAGGAIDTAYTGTVTASGTGLSGTVAVAAVAGRIKWSDLKLSGTSAVTLSFSASGLTGCSANPITPVTPQYDATALADGFFIELPREEVDFTYPTVSTTVTVGSGKTYSTVQAAIDAVVAADSALHTEILIDPGVYAEQVQLKKKATNSGWIILKNANGAPVSTGTRVQPSDFASGAVTISVENSRAIVQCDAGAHHYRFVGIEVKVPVPAGGTATNINYAVYLSQPDAADKTDPTTYPHHILFDRCYLHGGTGVELSKVLNIGGPYMGAIDCDITDAYRLDSNHGGLFATGDENAIVISFSAGPLTFINCRAAAAGECVIHGGTDPEIEDLIPSDITYRRCVFTKDPAWKDKYPIKNGFESKNGRRILVEDFVVENIPADQQSGEAFVLKSVNQGNTAPWCCTRHVTIRNGVVRNAVIGATIAAHPESAPSGLNKPAPSAGWIAMHHVVFCLGTGVAATDAVLAGTGSAASTVRPFQIFNNETDANGNSGSLHSLYTRHNTFASPLQANTAINLAVNGDLGQDYHCVDTLFPATTYLIFDAGLQGQAAITACFAGDVAVTKNVLPDPGGNQAGPTGNFFPAAASSIGYTDPTILSDVSTPPLDTVLAALQLTSGSAYHNAALDSTDIGADIPMLRTALAGVYDGAPASTATQLGMKLEPATWAGGDNTNPASYRPRQQNAYAALGKTFDYRIALAAYNSDGVTVDTSFTGAITATPSAGTLGGTVTRNAVAGIADFSDLYPATGTGTLSITFTSSGLTSFTTGAMTVVAPSYDALAFTAHGVQVEEPRAAVDPTLPTVFTRTIHVGATRSIVTGVSYKSVQAAFDYCTTDSGGANDISGNTQIILDVETFAEAITLRTRAAGKGWIVLCPAVMPTAEGTRADLTVKASMPQLSIENAQGIIQCAAGTHHVILAGLNIEVPVPTVSPEIFVAIETGNFAPTSLADLPHHIGIDRCLVHSTDLTQTMLRHAVSWNTGAGSYIVDSYLTDANSTNSDSQAIGIASGIGPWLIHNNYLNAMGEVILAGGSDAPFYDCKARDVTFTGNHLDKPMTGALRKNVFELKTAERWLVEGNVMEHSASGAQDGTGVLITSQNQAQGQFPGTAHAISQNFQGNADIIIRKNFFRTMVSWISATATNTTQTLDTRRLSIHDNVAVNINATVTVDSYSNRRSILIGDGIQDAVIEHNHILAEAGRGTLALNVDAASTINNPRTYYRNNLATCESYGIGGTSTGVGTSTTDVSMTDDTLPGNVFITGPNTGTNYAYGAVHGVGMSGTGNQFPPQSYYPAALSAVGVVDVSITSTWDTADPDAVCAALALASGSAYKGVATDSTDPGANITAVRAAIAGVLTGTPSPIVGSAIVSNTSTIISILDMVVASVDVEPPTVTVSVGSPTATVTGTAKNAIGQALPNPVFFRSSNTQVATVNKTSGLVTRVSSGTVNITGLITDPAATHLAVTTQPVGGVTGVALPTQPVFKAYDIIGTTDTAFTGNVTVTLNVLSGSPSLGGTTTVAAVNGVATFTNLMVTGTGTWTLTAAASGLTSVTTATGTTTDPFTPVGTPNQLTSGIAGSSTTTGALTFSTASVTPSATAATLLSVSIRGQVGANTPTVSGARATWTLVKKQTNQAANSWCYVWVGTGAVTPGQITVTRSSTDTWGPAIWSVTDYPNASQTTPIVAANVVGVTKVAADTVLIVPAAQTMGAGNALHAAFAFGAGSGTATPRSGWTELNDTPVASDSFLETQYRLSTDTQADATPPSGGYSGAGILCEINHA